MISEKGHGHYLNPENHSRLRNDNRNKSISNDQHYLK